MKPDFPNKKYQIIYADPPWSFNRGVFQDDERDDRLIEEQYRTMDKESLRMLPVRDLADENAALFLWVTDSHLKEGVELIERWGFTYRTIAFIWEKITKHGKTCATVGAWTMKNCEVCLLGIKGNMLQYKEINNLYQLVRAIRTSHSKKPDQVRRNIEQLFGDLPRIELFARERSYGWDAWGNEVDSDVKVGVKLANNKCP